MENLHLVRKKARHPKVIYIYIYIYIIELSYTYTIPDTVFHANAMIRLLIN